MDQKQCAKCSSMVPVSKAFCPECGNPMVAEEERKDAPEFDQHPATVQFSSSDFDVLKQKMELDISESPSPSEKADSKRVVKEITVPPEVIAVTEAPEPRNSIVWVVVLAVVFAFVVFLAVVLGIYLYMRF